MQVGMLWLDDDKKRPFDEKVLRAASYYKEKYGRLPQLCAVNQSALSEEKKVGKISVVPDRTIQPHYFWLGIEAG